ncbi:hypothetical protein [Methylomonas rhizoryzae]|uniref:hypothetical protein n=1 Tax=Methylomonas rhizoryzae TaxID=2608981 RepID=UPI0016810D50|nr:hypothetical protein [Methylomonas rhizoryzae]
MAISRENRLPGVVGGAGKSPAGTDAAMAVPCSLQSDLIQLRRRNAAWLIV